MKKPSFDEMLEQLKLRDRALREAHERFEECVRDRTRDLERAKAAAEVADQARSEIVAAMSQEMRTTMLGLTGYTDLLLETELSAEQRRYVDAISRSCAALLRLVDDLRDDRWREDPE